MAKCNSSPITFAVEEFRPTKQGWLQTCLFGMFIHSSKIQLPIPWQHQNRKTAHTVPHASDVHQQLPANLSLSPCTQQPAAKTHNGNLALEEVRVMGHSRCCCLDGALAWDWAPMSRATRALLSECLQRPLSCALAVEQRIQLLIFFLHICSITE